MVRASYHRVKPKQRGLLRVTNGSQRRPRERPLSGEERKSISGDWRSAFSQRATFDAGWRRQLLRDIAEEGWFRFENGGILFASHVPCPEKVWGHKQHYAGPSRREGATR